jgi:hypothetical protein
VQAADDIRAKENETCDAEQSVSCVCVVYECRVCVCVCRMYVRVCVYVCKENPKFLFRVISK